MQRRVRGKFPPCVRLPSGPFNPRACDWPEVHALDYACHFACVFSLNYTAYKFKPACVEFVNNLYYANIYSLCLVFVNDLMVKMGQNRPSTLRPGT